VAGFRKFVLRGNVVDLAVAVVMGAAFADVVKALVRGFITPLLGLLGGVPDFASWVITVNNSRFLVGEIINAVIGFIILAAVVYFFVVLPMVRFLERYAPGDPGIPKRECPECLSQIPQRARRCMFCTVEVIPLEPAAAN
jgi:large conductance mechanosensitive channel